MNALWKYSRLCLVATCLVTTSLGQSSAPSKEVSVHHPLATEPAICGESMANRGGNPALRLVCFQQGRKARTIPVDKAIIIGFVGGFVRRDDIRHPEVEFAAYLRDAYSPEVRAEVFANHDGKHALKRALELLNVNGGGVLASHGNENTKIIIYGHSWGASQAVTLARELGRLGIPVSLVILVDSVHKPGRNDAVIPTNVRNAVNFYQTAGLIHGRPRIRASDPELTDIIGNFQMDYRHRPINCDNYPWIVRHLNKPHHEIENDPLVWKNIASMIDSELTRSTPTMEAASLSSTSVVVK